MQRNRSVRGAAIVATIAVTTALLGGGPALGQTFQWDVDGDGDWSVDGNWDQTGFPNAATDNATILNPFSNTAVTVTVEPNLTRDVNDLTIQDNPGGSAHEVGISNNSFFEVSGDIDNAGTIAINAGVSASRLRAQGSDMTLDGGGTVEMNGANAIIDDAGGTQTVTVMDQTIEGQGAIGANSIKVANTSQGTIDANVTGQGLLLDPASTAAMNDFDNGGTLQASNGGVLQLTGSGGGEFDNTGGTIQATDGGTVQFLVGADITGGSIADNGGTVQVNAGNDATFRSVSFSGPDIFARNNSDFGVAGTITNTGTITIESTVSATDLDLQADTTLTGGGTVVLDGPNAGINETVSGIQTLTLDDQTIEGEGDVGQNTIKVLNTAGSTVDANVNGATLTVNPAGTAAPDDFDNQGMLQASNGGILRLTGNGSGEFDNTGGTIQALDSSEVELTAGADITGGEISTSGTGEVRAVANQDVFLRNLTQSGTFIAENNTDTGIAGTINNSGTMTIQAAGSDTDLDLQAATTLTGGGTVTLSGSNAGINDTVSGAQPLTIGDQTIEGQGQIGQNAITVVNQPGNTIDANVSGQRLTLDPASTAASNDFDNEGTLQATNGGILQLTGSAGGEFENTGGTIQALDGSELELTSFADVTGGELTTAGSGEIRANTGQNVFLGDLTQSGTFIAENNTDTGVSGIINNIGTMTIQAGASDTDLELQTNTELTGGGTVILSGGKAGVNDAGGTQRLTITNQTIEGRGNLGENTITVTNTAGNTVDANVNGATLTVNPANESGSDDVINQGTMQASNGGILVLTGSGSGEFNNTGGTIQALNNSEVELTSFADVTGGELTTAGSGEIRANTGQNVFLRDLTQSGNYIAENNSDTGVAGTINNTGTITIQAGVSDTDLELQTGGATLTGGGMVELSGSNAGVDDISGTQMLTIADQTIQGEGNIGQNTITVANQPNGLIDANVSAGTLTLDPASTGASDDFNNEGTMQASNGGTLLLTGSGSGEFDNTGGTIQALDNSLVTNTNSANLTNNNGGTLTGGTYRAVETGNGATVAMPGSAVTTIANSNTTVTLDGQFANVTFGGTTLENSLTTLEGTLRVLGGKNFDAANSITSSGVVEVSSGSSITTPSNTFEQTAGGTLFGEGTLVNTSDLAGNVSPGDGGMQGVGDAGTLTFDGDLQLSSDANLQFDLGALGDAQDLLDVIGTGDLTLDGTLTVNDLGGFEQGTYDLIEFDGSLTDDTLNAALPAGFTGSILTPSTGAPAGTVQLEAVPEPTSLALLGLGGGLMLMRRRRTAA